MLDRATWDAVVAAIDASCAIDLQGTLSALPAPGVRGRYYWATDAPGTLLRDTGTVWVQLGINGPARTRAFRSSGWTSALGAPVTLVFDNVTFDRAFAHYGAGTGYSTSTGLFTCPLAGVYSVKAKIAATSANVGDIVQASVFHNGAQTGKGTVVIASAAGQVLHSLATDDVLCAVGDTLSIGQTSGASTAIAGLVGSADCYACFNFDGQG